MTTLAGQASLPPKAKRMNIRDWEGRRILIIVVAVGAMMGVVVWLVWQDYSPVAASQKTDVAIILAPLLAAAAAVERLLEVIFDFIETQAVVQIVALMAKTEKWINEA